MMNKNIVITILATIVITFGGLALLGSMADDNYNGNIKITQTGPSLNDELLENDLLTVEEYSAYMDGCTGEGATDADCECMIEYLEDNYGRARIMDMADEMDYTGELTDEMWQAVDYCTMKYETL